MRGLYSGARVKEKKMKREVKGSMYVYL